jgi:outer membrane protein TolC
MMRARRAGPQPVGCGFGPALLLGVAVGLAGCGWMPGAPADASDPDPMSLAAEGTIAAPPRLPPSLAGTGFGQDVAQAVLTHPALSAGSARVRAAAADLDAQQSVFRPQVSIGADSAIRISGEERTRSTPLLQVEQLLFDGGAARSRTEAARARIEGSESDRVGTASGLALNAVEAAFVLEHERALLALADRDLAIHLEFLAQVQDRVGGGVGTEADLLSAESRTADARARRAAAVGRLERAQAAYVEAFGTAPPARLQTPEAPALPPGNDRELIRTSPRLESIDAQLQAARADLAATEASRLPRLSVALNGTRRDGGGSDVTADLRLRYDLSTGGQRQAEIRGATARVQEVEGERLSLERQIALSLEQVRADQRSGVQRRAAARAALEANRAAVDAAEEQFRVGRRSIGQLLDAQRDFVAASETLARVELDLALAGYAALALTGDILNVFGVDLPQAIPEEL